MNANLYNKTSEAEVMSLEKPTPKQIIAYENFVKKHSPENALNFILSCYKYIATKAHKWFLPGASRRDKIYDIMAEMYLVLLEDFCECKSEVCKSALSYLDLKIKRLIDPSRKHVFSDIDEVLPNQLSTVDSLTYEKLEMIDEIVQIVRGCVLGYNQENKLVPFLFIHIFPKIHWISELLAERSHTDVNQRYDTDRKRMNRFNERLRISFESLSAGDWHEILEWGQLERRHLAYRLTSISPKEVYSDVVEDLNLFAQWRENFSICQKQDLSKLLLAENILSSMNRLYVKNKIAEVAGEEAVPWGRTPDILSMLMGRIVESHVCVAEGEEPYKGICDKPEDDAEFMDVASELNKWFGNMLLERNKRASENRLNW